VLNRPLTVIGLLILSAGALQASVTLLLEEPFGEFGGMTPTGHTSVYLSRVCADSPVSLRRCHEGEQGVVISRYHRVSGYDWIAIPLVPYLYSVDRPDQVPATVSPHDVADLRDAWRRANLERIVPDADDGRAPKGDWIQLVGAAYDRTIYAFGIETTEQQDDRFIQVLNERPNGRDFNLFFHNCADFARQTIDFYYPHAVHRSFIDDMGVMTPKQAARSLVSYSKRHRDLQFSSFIIPQVAGTVPRSSAVRGFLQSFVKSKRYALPLVALAALHPYFGGTLALTWIEGRRFDPRRAVESADARQRPGVIAAELESNQIAAPRSGD
jgi:hypothetical protein